MRAASLIVGLSLAFGLANAQEGCTTTTPDVTVADRYVDSICLTFLISEVGCNPSLVAYEESNGIPGLQRDDDWVDDTGEGSCYPGDTQIF